jgi:hypothetical protein
MATRSELRRTGGAIEFLSNFCASLWARFLASLSWALTIATQSRPLLLASQVMSVAAPLPILGIRHQTARHRVAMHTAQLFHPQSPFSPPFANIGRKGWATRRANQKLLPQELAGHRLPVRLLSLGKSKHFCGRFPQKNPRSGPTSASICVDLRQRLRHCPISRLISPENWRMIRTSAHRA